MKQQSLASPGVFEKDRRKNSLGAISGRDGEGGAVVSAGGAATSTLCQGGPRAAAGWVVHYGVDLLRAVVVQPVGSGSGEGMV